MKKIVLLCLIIFGHLTFAQSDCDSAIPVCGDQAISYTPTGSGNTADNLGGGCLGVEHFSVWYSFSVATTGTLTFLITPNAQTDYDWAVYGPNVTCANKGTPLRCSFAATTNGILTGLNLTATDLTEGAGGDGFVRFMDVVAGQTYYLIVDNFSQSTVGFTLTWGGTATLDSSFNDPNLAPNPFLAPGPNQDGIIDVCQDPTIFDFSSLSAGIVNGNADFHVNYYYNSNDALTGNNPITTPVSVNSTATYHYAINYIDPNNANNPINKCKEFGTIEFDPEGITANNAVVLSCNNRELGNGVFDLTTANLYAGPGTFTTQYFPTMADVIAGTNEITNPTAFASPATTVFGLITTNLGCTAIGEISLQFYPQLELNEATIQACNNNFSGDAIFNLTTAQIYNNPNWTAVYYPSLTDAKNDTNLIIDPMNYESAEGTAYAVVTNEIGCESIVAINLQFYPAFEVYDDELVTCFVANNPTTGLFDLAVANVTLEAPVVRTYYNTAANAIDGTNPITNFNNYLSPEGYVFVRVTNNNGCWYIAKIKLTVTGPKYSPTLLDQHICLEDRIILDAGPGYDSYEWNTGEITQSINVGIGEYWVILGHDGCETLQKVQVTKNTEPIINKVEIVNNTVTLTVTGGTAPYEFSLDQFNWQASNIFENVPRGENTFYVKDVNDCEAVFTEVTVPNFVNAITPNFDGVNDYFDYSALGNKKDFQVNIYDRYGNRVFVAEKGNNYRWGGTINGGRRAPTGTYWYTATWIEPATNLSVKYDGWILVKNRD